jgi:hypothetical protein
VDNPFLKVITEELFGETSRLFRCFADEIPAMRGQHKLVQRCMGTFFWCCIQDEPLKEMHSPNSIVDASNMATEAEYDFFWGCIHNTDYQLNCNNESHRIETPFWCKVETALNTVLRKLFITGMEGRMQVTIDDDKVHYHITRIAKDFEPKPKQHVRDNRRGFTCDTAVFTATGVPVGVHIQGKNDSTTTSTKSLIRMQFAPADGGNDARALTNMGFGFDHGFLAYGLCKDLIDMGGSFDASTTRHMEWIPFTYGQKLRLSDKRTDIPTTGPKVLLQQTYKGPGPSHHQLNCFGYRNGNGGITLALSSEHSGTVLGCVY